MGRAQDQGRAISIAQGTSEPAVEQTARGSRFRFFAARHSWRWHSWRIYLHTGRPFGQRYSVPRQEPGRFSRGRPKAAGDCKPQHHFSGERPARVCRGKPRQSAEARREPQRCLPDDPSVHGWLFHQLLQPLWPPVAGIYRSGKRRSRQAENVGQFYVRNNKGENVPLSTLTSIKSRLGPEFTLRFNEYRSAQVNGSAAPGYSADQATAALE